MFGAAPGGRSAEAKRDSIPGARISTSIMEFEWDPAKAAGNLAKHGVDFDDAIAVFGDPRALHVVDPRSYGEARHRAIGTVRGRILLVVYTMRGGQTCRILGARRASRRERTAYSLQARN